MATTTTALQFKSYKGGERRAEGQDGSVYSIKRVDEGVFETSVRLPGEKKFAPLGGGDATGARQLADQHYTNPDEGQPPTFVQEGAGTETVEQVLASIPDPEVEDVRNLVAETDAKARKLADDKVKRAARKTASPVAPVLPLVFEPFRGDADEQRAKGARHVYRITQASTGFYAAQRQSGGFTPIAGKCATFDEAVDLATRYEKGARQLSHRQFHGMPYAKVVTQLDGGK